MGYNAGRNRGANAAANLMRTYPKLTGRWWEKEFAALRAAQQQEEMAETEAAFKLAAERGDRFQEKLSGS